MNLIQNNRGLEKEGENLNFYKKFIDAFEKYPFIVIIGKYDHILGPRILFSSVPLNADRFIRDLLRDALNTKNQFVILDFNQFYTQVNKIEIEDPTARGGKQLYAIILLRDVELPLIPILHFKRIGMIFHKINLNQILSDDVNAFEDFFKEVSKIYMRKDEILPFESLNMQIRSGINTIQGFCEILQESIKIKDGCLEQDISNYVEMMLDSCEDIINALNIKKSTE